MTDARRERRESDRIRLGSHVRSLREARGLTQQDVADALGLTRVTINRFEAGATDLAASRLFLLAELLQVEPGRLLELPASP